MWAIQPVRANSTAKLWGRVILTLIHPQNKKDHTLPHHFQPVLMLSCLHPFCTFYGCILSYCDSWVEMHSIKSQRNRAAASVIFLTGKENVLNINATLWEMRTPPQFMALTYSHLQPISSNMSCVWSGTALAEGRVSLPLDTERECFHGEAQWREPEPRGAWRPWRMRRILSVALYQNCS